MILDRQHDHTLCSNATFAFAETLPEMLDINSCTGFLAVTVYVLEAECSEPTPGHLEAQALL